MPLYGRYMELPSPEGIVVPEQQYPQAAMAMLPRYSRMVPEGHARIEEPPAYDAGMSAWPYGDRNGITAPREMNLTLRCPGWTPIGIEWIVVDPATVAENMVDDRYVSMMEMTSSLNEIIRRCGPGGDWRRSAATIPACATLPIRSVDLGDFEVRATQAIVTVDDVLYAVSNRARVVLASRIGARISERGAAGTILGGGERGNILDVTSRTRGPVTNRFGDVGTVRPEIADTGRLPSEAPGGWKWVGLCPSSRGGWKLVLREI